MSVLPPGGLLEDAFAPRYNPRTINTQSSRFLRSKAYFPALLGVLPPGGLLEDAFTPRRNPADRHQKALFGQCT